MSTIFSRQCEYAIQAILFLALKEDDKMTSIRELTQKFDIPYHFLAKILQNLTHRGFLKSSRGSSGGFSLAKPASEITLLEIVSAIDGTKIRESCIMGFPDCSDTTRCALHDYWAKAREEIFSVLEQKTIDHMAKAMKKSEYSEG